METEIPASCCSRTCPLETFLVEWKLAISAKPEGLEITLETFLVEWKRKIFWEGPRVSISLKPS